MADDSGQEKTEEATPKRRSDTRDKGQVPRSRELNTVISLMLSAAGLMFYGETLVSQLAAQMSQFLTITPDQLKDNSSVLIASSQALTGAITALLPVLAVALLSAFFGPVVMGGWIFKLSSLEPKLSKLDPLKGLGKIFSRQGLMELLKALVKFFLVASIATLFISLSIMEILGIGTQTLGASVVHAGSLISTAFLVISSILILIAVVDVPFQLAQFSQKMKMTKQEIKDEMKETDGRPEVKNRIRSLQHEISKRRMMEDLKDADVVITNPTHFAVALKYSEDRGVAPVVVAKGRDQVAFQIMAVARHHEILVFQAPPLARALYATTELQQEIPADLYVAVAQVLAYVYQLKDYSAEARPQPPRDISVPDDYRDLNL